MIKKCRNKGFVMLNPRANKLAATCPRDLKDNTIDVINRYISLIKMNKTTPFCANAYYVVAIKLWVPVLFTPPSLACVSLILLQFSFFRWLPAIKSPVLILHAEDDKV